MGRHAGICSLVVVSLIATLVPGSAGAAGVVTPEMFAAETAAMGSAGAPAGQLPVAGRSAPSGVYVPGAELVGRRTRFSRTVAGEDGTLRTRVFGQPIHYRDSQGGWQPIDARLVAADEPGYAARSAANSFRLLLPQRLDRPVRLDAPGGGVGFGFADAAASQAQVFERRAVYRDVWADTDVVLSTTADGVKEELVVWSAAAPSRFAFPLLLPAGVTAASVADGSVQLRTADGGVVATIPAPFVYEAASTDRDRLGETGMVDTDIRTDVVAMTLEQTADGTTLVVQVDPGWLGDPQRSFPVVVDPTVRIATSNPDLISDTFIDSANPDSRAPSSVANKVTSTGGATPTQLRRSLVDLRVRDGITEPAQVLDANLHMTVTKVDAPAQVAVMRTVAEWQSGAASWNSRLTGVLWDTPGGDYDPTPQHTIDVNSTAVPYGVDVPLTRLVQGWLDDSIPQHGVGLKLADEAASTEIFFASSNHTDPAVLPYLDVTYRPAMGLKRIHQYETFELGDRRTAYVNVASGNLVVREQDVTIKGTGLDATVQRFYNSRSEYQGSLGERWTMWPGSQERLSQPDADTALWFGGPQHVVLFRRQTDGSWKPDQGVEATLTRNADGTDTITWPRTNTRMIFSAGGYLDRIVDRNNNTVQLGYTAQTDGDLWLSGLTDTQGRLTSFTYTADTQLTRIVDPASREHVYGYDTTGPAPLLTSYTDPANHTTSYAYDTDRRLQRITDPNGNATVIGYDTKDRVVSLTRVDQPDGTGPTWSLDYTTPLRTVVTDPNGHATTYHYDRTGRVAKVVDALGNEQAATYTAGSNIASYTDQVGGTPVLNTYTATDAGIETLATTQLPTGATTTFDYLDADNPFAPSKLTSPQGNATIYDYDAPGNLATITDAQTACTGGCVTTLARNPDGTIDTVTDPAGRLTDYGYDLAGNLTSITPPAPLGATTLTYDALSRVATVTDGRGKTTSYGYDALDRLTSVTFHGGTQIAYSYDPVGNRTARSDPTGTTTISYDPLNRITGETFPGNRTTAYRYDPPGNLLELTDPAGTVTYTYNAVDLVATITEPGATAATSFTYDAANRRDTLTYPNGVVQDYTFDASGRVTDLHATRSGVTLTRRRYTYTDPSSGADTALRQTVTDENGNTTTYRYDTVDRLTDATTRDPNNTVVEDHGYSYDAAGNLTRRTDDALQTQFTYNAANQLLDATDKTLRGLSVRYVVHRAATLAAGEAALHDRMVNTHGMTVTLADATAPVDLTGVDLVVISQAVKSSEVGTKYADAAVPVINFEGSTWFEHGYATQEAAEETNTNTVTPYTHAGAHPIVDGPFGAIAGTTQYATATTTKTTYSNTGDLAAPADWAVRPTTTDGRAAIYTYDQGDTLANATPAAGPRVAIGFADSGLATLTAEGWTLVDNTLAWAAPAQTTTTYNYDLAGNLTGASDGTALGYDDANRTTTIDLPDTPAQTASYAGHGQFERATLDATTFTHSILGVTATQTTATTGYTRDPNGNLTSLRTPNGTGYPLTDALGSVIAVTDTNGAVVNHYDYTPYGRTTETRATGALDNPWRFTGAHHDPGGLYKMGARYHHPNTARWTQTDPALHPHQLPFGNEYLYANSNPTNLTDPAGEQAATTLCVAGTAFLGGEVLAGIGEGIAGLAAHGLLTTGGFVGLTLVGGAVAAAVVIVIVSVC